MTRFLFAPKLRQSLFKLALFGRQTDGQDLADLLVKLPHLIDGHRVKIQLFGHPRLSHFIRLRPEV
ncbi:MAG: hypothetical protein ABI561_18945, partial [Bradyrhizobium sp.]